MSTYNAFRRKVLRQVGAIAGATACATSWRSALAAPPALAMGLLRNPVAGLVSLGEHKGWFKEAGVDLQTVLFVGAGGPKVLQAMGGGSIALGSVSATAALLALAGRAVPLRIVSIATDPAPLFVLQSGPEIASVRDLAGKRVATTAGTGLQYFLVRALTKYGMSLTDVEFVNLPAGDAQSAFLAKRVEAVVPSLAGAAYIRTLRKDTRDLFTRSMFAQPPGSVSRFDDYDVFVAPASVVAANAPALRAFLAAYHGKCVPYLHNPATQSDAVAEVTRYVNAEQKTPTDELAMRSQLLDSGFFDLGQAKAIMTSAEFRAGLDDQVRFLMSTKQLAGRIDLDGVIATELFG
ncbi:MAG: ABC transporter substrate-binding protein [Betaproteobacteria bacterium]